MNKLNRNHEYYYQIQGQMHITGREYCIFVLYTPKGIKWVREEYDYNFWKEKMEPKLTRFYMDCLLPEIVNPRVSRNMDPREPPYVIQAQEQQKQRKIENDEKKKAQSEKNIKGMIVKKEKLKKMSKSKSSDTKKLDLTIARNDDSDSEKSIEDEPPEETALSRTKKMFEKKYFRELSEKSKGTSDLKSAKIRLWNNLKGYLPKYLQVLKLPNVSKVTPKIKTMQSPKKTIKKSLENLEIDKPEINMRNHSDCDIEIVEVSYDVNNMTDKSVQNLKNEFDNRPINIQSLNKRILSLTTFVDADCIDAFLRVQMRRETCLVSQSVFYLSMGSSKLIEAVQSPSVQIIGGNFNHHWRVLYFDGKNMILYDSYPELTNGKLHERESAYVKLRFPRIKEKNITVKKMLTQQPDGYSCGIFSAAYVESIISGKDPSEINYSTNMSDMRHHFFNIIESNTSSPFPYHPIYQDEPGIDNDLYGANEEQQMLVDLVNVQVDQDQIILSILQEFKLLYDEAIQAFLEILQAYSPHLEIHEVQHFFWRKLLRPAKKEKHLQIIGGQLSDHWICLYYDGKALFILDSKYKSRIELYGEKEKRYIQKRYPHINFNDIKLVHVTQQPDGYSCGVYAAAFATEIAMGNTPLGKEFSENPMKMRKHLAEIVRSKILVPFPEKKRR